MNINARFRSNATRALDSIKSGSKKVAAAGTLALVGAQSAMAQSTGFDESEITAAITSNLGKALIVVGAFLVAVWTLRAMGLLGKR